MKRPPIKIYGTLHKFWFNDILYSNSLRAAGIVKFYYWQPDYSTWVYLLKMKDGTKCYEFEQDLTFLSHFH